MRPGPNGQGLSRKAIMGEVDHSLRRLGTDYVDAYMIHRLDNPTPVEETLGGAERRPPGRDGPSGGFRPSGRGC
jgi:aryl-alcohol dehydrogenase-like predicted oxidoreductase